jgi:uncharacterized membrane protein YhaH (DUF805 family)
MDVNALFDNYRRTITEHFFDMHGRVGRSQFWYFVLVNFVFGIIAAILQSVVFLPLAVLYNLAMLLPAAGMGARRLQDTGRDGKLVWIFLIAGFISQVVSLLAALSVYSLGFAGFFLFGAQAVLINLAFLVACVVMIYFWVQPGDPGDNAYGPSPPVFDPSQRVSPTP